MDIGVKVNALRRVPETDDKVEAYCNGWNECIDAIKKLNLQCGCQAQGERRVTAEVTTFDSSDTPPILKMYPHTYSDNPSPDDYIYARGYNRAIDDMAARRYAARMDEVGE